MGKRFGVGDTVALTGIVRLVDVASEGTVTVELQQNGQRITLWAEVDGMELVSKAKPDAFSKAPKRRQKRLVEAGPNRGP